MEIDFNFQGFIGCICLFDSRLISTFTRISRCVSIISDIKFGICIVLQEGDFEMIHIDRVGSRSFNVAIAPFSLSLLGDDDVHTI